MNVTAVLTDKERRDTRFLTAHGSGTVVRMIVRRTAYFRAIEDFHEARRQAAIEQILARLRGRPDTLLAYDEVREMVGERSQVDRGLKEIPLEQIVGSVGRYSDFTRKFLPRSDIMQDRWARVKTVATEMSGWPPIEVYQLGDVYFVIDGNHRVSVARQMGIGTIPAYVTEVKTLVPLTADIDPEQLIIKSRQVSFLRRMGLDKTRPDANLVLTEAGAYRKLEEHISVHRYYMGIEEQREISLPEAAAHWYDVVYLPIAAIIRERGLLHDFPDRTEADLYLWMAEHRAELEEALGWEIAPDRVAEDLASSRGARGPGVIARVGDKLLDVFTPDELEPGPPPGAWRAMVMAARREDRLFYETLVTLNGHESGWRALEQGIVVARREEGVLRALHVTAEGVPVDEAVVSEMQDRFAWRMGEVGLRGRLVVEKGAVARTICDRARWNDLVVMPLTYPPGPRVLERLGSSVRTILLRSARPVLATPGEVSQMRRALLAYDGSPTADEALFVSAYLAGRWGTEVVVLTVVEPGPRLEGAPSRVQAYLEEQEVAASYVVREGELAPTVMGVSEEFGCDFIVIGGYGRQPVIELVRDSGLNDVLRLSTAPVLICR